MNPWWSNGIVYHLYIKSFFDFDQNGMGDLKGVTQKLDYLAQLGVDAIWLSPYFDSPMRDNGYDISDYLNVNPLFGSNADLDELFTEMKKRKMKIIIDLVLNHSSKDHVWFKKALNDPQSKYRNYYIFKDESEINNARSIFGNSTWEPVGNKQYYYHTFAVEQPDLNWENPELRQEIYDIVNFWLKKGVDGFRLDAITFIKKNPDFPRFEADDEDGLFNCTKSSLNQVGILDFLREFKEKTWGDRPIYTVGEAAGVSFEDLPNYISPKGILTSIFDFSYTDIDISGDAWKLEFDWTYAEFQRRLDIMQLNTQKTGMGVTYLENHDNPRSLNKFFQKLTIDPKHHFSMASALQMFFLFLRGTAYIYQGEELGMINVNFRSIDEIEDLHTIDQYERAIKKGMSEAEALRLVNKRSRDHSRVPVYWSKDQLAQTNRAKPYVKTHDDYGCDPVEVQTQDPYSVLNFMRTLIQIKKSEDMEAFLINSEYVVNPSIDGVISYKRVLDFKTLTLYINMTDSVKKVSGYKGQVFISNNNKKEFDGTLEAYESIILRSF